MLTSFKLKNDALLTTDTIVIVYGTGNEIWLCGSNSDCRIQYSINTACGWVREKFTRCHCEGSCLQNMRKPLTAGIYIVFFYNNVLAVDLHLYVIVTTLIPLGATQSLCHISTWDPLTEKDFLRIPYG